MSEIRKRIELWFESFGHLVFRHRWTALLLLLTLVGALAAQVPRIRLDTSTESFLHKGDPTLLTYNDFRNRFGRDEVILIAIQPPDVFTQSFLKKLKALHQDLEDQVPHAAEITSLVNARNTRGQGDRLIVEELLEKWPEDEAALETLRARVLSNQLYLNRLISEDGRFTTVVIKTETYSSQGSSAGEDEALEGFEEKAPAEARAPEFLTDAENSAVVNAARGVIARYEAPDFKVYLAGSPVFTDVLKRSMVKDITTFIRLVILVIGLCLFIMFRRLTGVLLPLLIVALALVSTLGLMVICGVPMTLPTNILPSFLLAVGVGAAVHVLSMFYRNFDKTGDREEAISQALGHSGLAIVLTSLTTAAGLASFAAAEVAPLAHLGLFASLGVMLALVYTIVLLPAFLAIIPVRRKRSVKTRSDPPSDRLLNAIADFSTSHASGITAAAVIIIVVSLVGAASLSFSHNPMIWMPTQSQIRKATEKVDLELKGTVVLEVMVDTGRENGLYEVETLNKLEGLAREIEGMRQGKLFVGKAASLADMLKEIHQALNENRPEFNVIPQDPALIPQEFLLFENSGSDDLEDVVDSQFRTARFTIKVPWGDAVRYMPFLTDIEKRFKNAFEGRAEITVTGMMSLLVRTLNAAIFSTARSYLIAFVVITLMMILLIGSIKVGLVSMVPNLLPVVLTLGVIGWLGFPFDMFTMLIGSIAIGLAVDDTVHFMHNYRRYFYESKDVRLSVRQTLTTAGRAMLVTSIVLSLGFFVFMFASMKNLYFFGLLTGITIITALLADFLVAPALMALINRKQEVRS